MKAMLTWVAALEKICRLRFAGNRFLHARNVGSTRELDVLSKQAEIIRRRFESKDFPLRASFLGSDD